MESESLPPAEFVHGLDESDDVLDRSLRQYAVAEVEDVAGAVRRPVENDFGAAAYDVGRGEECDRVEVAHDGNFAEPRPCVVEPHAPVEADNVAARLLHQLKKSGSARAEVYDGDAGLDALDDLARVRQDVFAVVVVAQSADPRVEDLDGLRAGLYLRVEVARERARDCRHQRVPCARVRVHQTLCVDVVLRAAALADV